jgi:transposase
MTISVLAIDLAKHVFQLHGVDRSEVVVLRKRLKRTQLLAFVQSLPPCTIAMEACSSAHFWGREFARLGHTVKLLPPQYVKPYGAT